MLSDRLNFNQKTKVIVACSLIGFISLLILIDLLINTRAKDQISKDSSVVISKANDKSVQGNTANSEEKTIEQLIKEIENKEIMKIANSNSSNSIEKGAVSLDGSKTAANNSEASQNKSSTYTVQSGDSYWTISKKLYGKGSYWKMIQELNPNVDSSRLRQGMNIQVPSEINDMKVIKGSTEVSAHSNTQSNSSEYVVRKGDTIWKVAKMVQRGSSINEKIEILVSANKNKISNYSLLPGTKLRIP